MQTLERNFEDKCMKMLKNLDNSWWPPKTDPGPIRGLPDRMGVVGGQFVALEFKRSSKESTSSGRARLQRVTLEQIREAGGKAYFVCPETWGEIFAEITLMSYRGNNYGA